MNDSHFYEAEEDVISLLHSADLRFLFFLTLIVNDNEKTL